MQYTKNHDLMINYLYGNDSVTESDSIKSLIQSDNIFKERFIYEKKHVDIERYICDEMSIGERFEFEETLKDDPEFAADFNLNKKVNNALEIMALEMKLNEIYEETFSGKKFKKIIFRPELVKWVVAASVALLLVSSGAVYFFTNNKVTGDSLYSNYYETFQDSPDHYFLKNSSLAEAKKRYQEKNYGDALILLGNLPDSITIEDEKILYSGLTYMELGRFEDAIGRFELMQTGDNYYSFFQPNAKWYLALCYLKTGNYSKAKKVLESIVNDKGYNYKEAGKILKKLKD